MSKSHGQMVRIPEHYDPKSNPRSPSYDPKVSQPGTVTGRGAHQPPQEK